MLRKLLDSPWTYFAGAGVLLIVAIASQFEIRFPAREVRDAAAITTLRDRDDVNVVFMLIDTLRADRLGTYGYGRPTSPTMDALARSGVVFERVVSQSSWTKTSMASIWTAAQPANHGILRYNHVIPQEAVLPAEIFRDAGFMTAGIWRNGWVSPNFGFGQGFNVYIRPRPGKERKELQRRHPAAPGLRGTDEDLADGTVEFLDNFGDQRFLLYLHFMDVHQYVFDEASARFGTSYSDAYDQSISWTDRVISFLLAELERRDLLDHTLIVIASDHGEEFREHGFEGHARTLHREVVYVPLIIAFPFQLDPGIRVRSVVSNLDMWPTILDLIGLPPVPGADGVSLVPDILAAAGAGPPPQDGRHPVISQLDRRWGRVGTEPEPLLAVTDGNLRLLMALRDPDAASLYDLASDPVEAKDVAAERPEDVAKLRGVLKTYVDGRHSPWGVDPDEVELDAMRLDQLRALGYVIK